MTLTPTAAGSGSGSGAITLLSTTTLAAPGTFDVSGLSSSYTNLLLVLIGRDDAAVTGGSAAFRLNADSGSNYGYEYLAGVGTAASAVEVTSNASVGFAALPGGSSPANAFGVCELTIYGYASTSFHKGFTWAGFAPQNTTTGNLPFRAGGGTWRSTAAATRVQIAASGAFGNPLSVGSQLRIYGIT